MQNRAETLRSFGALRAQKARHRTPAPEPGGLLGWVRPTLQLRGERTLALVGMDAYMMLRFCRVCTRMCLFASCLGASRAAEALSPLPP